MAITRPGSVVRDFASCVLAFWAGLPDAEEAIWTPEEQADYEVWERDFAKSTEDPEPDPWLDWTEAEFTWDMPVPSCAERTLLWIQGVPFQLAAGSLFSLPLPAGDSHLHRTLPP